MVKSMHIAPSILAADYARLGEEIRSVDVAGADLIHLDIMDGHFVPNISFGPDVVKAVRPSTELYFDVHLMLSNPLDYLGAFFKAGANGISLHVEAVDDLKAALGAIKKLSIDAGVAVNPNTPIDDIPDDCWAQIDRLVIMTVQPGFGGQQFINQSDKIAQAAAIKEDKNLDFDIQIDGGINENTAQIVTQAGATTLVAGSAIFKTDNYADAITRLRGAGA